MPHDLVSQPTPRVYCDFNDRLGPTTYGLRVNDTIADLARQRLGLVSGMPLVLYDEDGFDDGMAAWIVVDAIVEEDADLGFVAHVDPDSFRWVFRRGDPATDLSSLGRFRVEEMFELPGRGVFLAGTIISGSLRIGQTAAARQPDGATIGFEIDSIGFKDNISTGSSRVVIQFRDRPADLLRRVIADGTVLDFA